MKLSIAQVVCVYPPYRGGIGTMAAQHALSLARAGHEVTVLTPRFQTGMRPEEERHGYRIIRPNPLFQYGNAAFCPSFFNIINNAEIVHLHYPFFGGVEAVWLAKILSPKKFKLVVTYHMDTVGKGLVGAIYSIHRRIFLPLILKAADRIIITSLDYARHSFLSRYLKIYPEKFSVIPPEVNTEHFHPKPYDELMKRHGLKETDQVLLFVGGLDKAHYFKGLSLLLEACRPLMIKNPNLKLVVVGKGDLQSGYEIDAENLGIHEQVIFAGGVSYEELPAYYSLADLFVLPSIDASEAFGIVLIEALSCGTPILSSDLPGVRTVTEGGVGQTFQTGNIRDLEAKIEAMLADGAGLAAMGAAGLAKVKNEYDSNVIQWRLIEAYEKTIDNNE